MKEKVFLNYNISQYQKELVFYKDKEYAVPLSGKEMRKLFVRAGYEVVPGGKGSHWKLKKKGCPTVIIPDHKELKVGTEHDLKKLLSQVQG